MPALLIDDHCGGLKKLVSETAIASQFDAAKMQIARQNTPGDSEAAPIRQRRLGCALRAKLFISERSGNSSWLRAICRDFLGGRSGQYSRRFPDELSMVSAMENA